MEQLRKTRLNEEYFEGESFKKLNGYAYKLSFKFPLPKGLDREDLAQEGLTYLYKRREEWSQDRFPTHPFANWGWKIMHTGIQLLVRSILGHNLSPHKKNGYLDTMYALDEGVYGQDPSIHLDQVQEAKDFLQSFSPLQQKAIILRYMGFRDNEATELYGHHQNSAISSVRRFARVA